MKELIKDITKRSLKRNNDEVIKPLINKKADTTYVDTELGKKANSSHGTHVTYSTTTPLANGTASAGSASTVARTDHVHPLQTTVSGNAGSATKLATARTINGTSFDGSANITTANWGTARNITIGNTAKSVNGSGNVAWTLSEIGAAPASHSHASVVMNNCSNKDLNTIKTAGFYYGYTGMTNAPVQAIAVLEVLVYSADWIVQRFTVVGDGGRKYERHFHSGTTWSAWRTLYDSSNKPTPAEIGAAASSHTHNYAGSSSAGGNANAAVKLATARKIGVANFDGTADIQLGAIAGRANISSSVDTNANKFSKFARIDLSGGAYRSCSGTLEFIPTEASSFTGELYYYFRTGSAITSTSIVLDWKTISNTSYIASVVAVKVSDGVYDLYYKPIGTWDTMSVTNVNSTGTSHITLYSSQGYVNSVTAAATSRLSNTASSVAGNASTATTLQTARTINGTSFNGSANITTANWGTARNIYIADNDGTNTGSAVSVNGSGNATLKLPATIKASLSGNASTATKATQDSAGQQINTTYIKGLSISGKTITFTKGDGTTGTLTTQDTNTTYSVGTASALGLTKLYTGTGTATDGTMTQNAINTALNGKANSSHTHSSLTGTSGSTTAPSTGTGVMRYDYNVSSANAGTLPVSNNANGILTLNTHSGNYYNQLGFSSNGNLYYRAFNGAALDATTAWKQVAFTNSSITGNAGTATTLQTARTINGTSFNGSANITTANWGTARNIYIADSTGANTGTAVSVNGSGNVTLKLPSTITATLSGNATSATKATQDSAGQQINTTYIKGLSVNGKTITYTKGDGSTGTITTQDTNTTYSTGTSSSAGLTKLYTGTGTATDGTMTQAAIKTALDAKADSSHGNHFLDKSITTGFETTFRTSTKGNSSAGTYFTVVRTDTGSVSCAPQYGSGIVWGKGDTHGYLNVNYSTALAYIGGGNGDKLNWAKQLAFTDSSITGNAATATTLQTPRTIAISGGATGTATSFNGSSNISIPITDIKESYLSWGGRNFSGTYGPLDASLIPELGANRLAFMPANAVTVEYSRDGGTTWTTYSTSDSNKINLFNGNGAGYIIGADSTTGIDKSKYMLRITITAEKSKVYSQLNKFAIYCSTNGSSGCYCTIDVRTQANYKAGNNTWATLVSKQDINGWSGWNIINTGLVLGTNNDQHGQLRFTFGVTSHASSVTYAGLSISKIVGYGGVGWGTPSTMAACGRMYTYDANQNVTFPAVVAATSFSGNASSATKATQDSAGQQINTTYIKGLSASGTTITYIKGNGSTGTITTQDTNTWRGVQNNLTSDATDQSLSAAQGKVLKGLIDGKAAASHGRHVPDNCTTITDWNSAVTNGWYMANNAANAPTTGVWYFGEVIAHNNNYVFQTVYQFNASTDAKAIPKYIRTKMNGTWGAWTNVTVAKAVPSNAVFTDTNTWRGVQDNLTSTATDQSLSANQGRVLKGLVDGKAASSHTHNSITNQDTRNANTTPTQMPLGLSVHLKSNGTDGLSDGGSYHSTLMMKGWNDISGGPWGQLSITQNNNLYFRSSADADNWNTWKKVSLDGHTHNYAAASHTHNYAGSSSAGGAATTALSCTGNSATATKLATARTISIGGVVSGSASFDGSGNITITTVANDITTISKSLKVTTDWMDTGITGTNLSTGTYAVQMLVNDGNNTSQWQEYYSGMMSWFADTTNSTDADEILLHKAGHASNGRHVYLRTIRTANSGRLKLQISSSNAFTAASSITFKFKKLI